MESAGEIIIGNRVCTRFCSVALPHNNIIKGVCYCKIEDAIGIGKVAELRRR